MDAAEGLYTISVEDYLNGEKDAPVKHEYVRGEVFAMADASDVHNAVAGNIHTVLNLASRKANCRTYISDMKVRVGDKLFYYPDVMLVCEDDPDEYYKEKPCVIVEVLSSSTNRTDKNEKRHAYLSLASLQLYLIVDSRRQYVLGHYRTKTGWQERLFVEGETVPFPCADVELTFEDIYIQTSYS